MWMCGRPLGPGGIVGVPGSGGGTTGGRYVS